MRTAVRRAPGPVVDVTAGDRRTASGVGSGVVARPIATNTTVDLTALLDFVRPRHRMLLATARRDGRPQVSPVSGGVDADGRVVVSSRETAVKTRNLRRDPRAFLCVFTDRFFGGWVQVNGTADVLSLPDAMEPLVDYYRSAAGEHPDWDEYRAAMRAERRVLLRITPTSAGPNVSG